MRRSGLALVSAFAAISSLACARGATIPDPKAAAEAWAAAVERCTATGDGATCDPEAIHAMLTRRSRATMSRAEVAAAVKDSKRELAAQAAGVREAKDRIATVAVLRYEDGTEASLVLEDQGFRVANAVHLPGPSKSPEEAVAGFRVALKQRSYPAVLRLLSPTLRAAVEAQLAGLEKAIPDDPKKVVPSDQKGDVIDVPLENGHRLRLKRIDGSWYIDDFE